MAGNGEVDYDDYYYSNNGEEVGEFRNYIPKTVNPGYWMLVFTICYSFMTVILIPVFVVWGKRYAKYKESTKELEDDIGRRKLFDGDDMMEDVDLGGGNKQQQQHESGTPRTEVMSPEDYSSKQRQRHDRFDFDGDDLYPTTTTNNTKPIMKTPHGRRNNKPRSTIIGMDQKSIISGMGSTLSGVSRFGRHANSTFEGIGAPRVMGGGAATTVGFSHSQTARTVLSSPVLESSKYRAKGGGSLMTYNHHHQSNMRGFRNNDAAGAESMVSVASTTSFLDAGTSRAGRRRGGRVRRGCRTSSLEDRQKMMEKEEKAQIRSSANDWIGREKVIAHDDDMHSSSSMSMRKMRRRMAKQQLHNNNNNDNLSRISSEPNDIEKSLPMSSNNNNNNSPWSVQHGPQQRTGGLTKSSMKKLRSGNPSHVVIDDIRPDDAADADDPGRAKEYFDEEDLELTACCGPRALWHRRTLAAGFDKLILIAEPDQETKRIIRLGIPFTAGEIMECLFDSITVIIISQKMSTDDLAAYVTVALMIGLTDEFIGGVIYSQETLCTHAYGAGQNFLCGQYVQISSLIYGLVSLPVLAGWVWAMRPVTTFLGFGESIVRRSTEYTRVVVFHYLVEGVSGTIDVILEITGHEVFGLISDVIEGIIDCVAVGLLVYLKDNATLTDVAFIHFGVATVFIVGYFSIVTYKGWLAPFWKGMFGQMALKNTAAVKNIIHTAIPLSIGSFLEYGEWELLTFCIAALGPAEVAVWALLGSVWEIFEASTVGLSSAAEIRVAYHLGKRNPELAKLSAYKSLFLSTVAGVFITAVLFMMGPNIATWFTKDPTLQHMLNDLIPIIGIGNIAMTFGMTCWSIVGAQGRYRLATCVSMASSWFVTIPLALFFTVGIKIDLQGVVSAVVAGHCTSGLALSYILLTCDWKKISDAIYEINLAAGEYLSDDSDAESSSSSGSSVSSESDSDDESSDDSDDETDLRSAASKSIISRKSKALTFS